MRVISSRTLMTPHEESQSINEGKLLQNPHDESQSINESKLPQNSHDPLMRGHNL
jgi:hypothetical protein